MCSFPPPLNGLVNRSSWRHLLQDDADSSSGRLSQYPMYPPWGESNAMNTVRVPRNGSGFETYAFGTPPTIARMYAAVA